MCVKCPVAVAVMLVCGVCFGVQYPLRGLVCEMLSLDKTYNYFWPIRPISQTDQIKYVVSHQIMAGPIDSSRGLIRRNFFLPAMFTKRSEHRLRKESIGFVDKLNPKTNIKVVWSTVNIMHDD